MKKIKKNKFICYIIIFVLVVFIGSICILTIFPKKDRMILNGYYDSKLFYDTEGFRDYSDYCIYYYKLEDDVKFQKNKYYIKITDYNIDYVKSYFTRHKEFKTKDYDFDVSIINIGDYYHLETRNNKFVMDTEFMYYDNYSMYYYSVEKHSLFYIHLNM